MSRGVSQCNKYVRIIVLYSVNSNKQINHLKIKNSSNLFQNKLPLVIFWCVFSFVWQKLVLHCIFMWDKQVSYESYYIKQRCFYTQLSNYRKKANQNMQLNSLKIPHLLLSSMSFPTDTWKSGVVPSSHFPFLTNWYQFNREQNSLGFFRGVSG